MRRLQWTAWICKLGVQGVVLERRRTNPATSQGRKAEGKSNEEVQGLCLLASPFYTCANGRTTK